MIILICFLLIECITDGYPIPIQNTMDTSTDTNVYPRVEYENEIHPLCCRTDTRSIRTQLVVIPSHLEECWY
jgi:hypothetical protein